jgi:voltage-gated potassium channel
MDERSQRIADRFEVPMLIAAALVIPVIIIEEANPGEPLDTIAAVLNYGIWIAFLVEVVVMLAVVPDRWLWLRKHPIEVIIVVLTPPFLLAALAPVRALRLLRLGRLLQLAPLIRRLFTPQGVKYTAVLALLTALAAGEAFHAVEEDVSRWNGVYWAIATMTTVGYGDINPMTEQGKVIAVIVMIVGIGFVALVTGAVAERFLAPRVDQVEEAEQEIERTEEDLLRQVRQMSAQLADLERALVRQFAER